MIRPKLSTHQPFTNSLLWRRLRNWDVINDRRRIPVWVQVIVSTLEWPRVRQRLVQVAGEVPRIGSQSGIEFGNGDVSDLELLPSLFLVRSEYFVERLFKGLPLVDQQVM